MTSRLSKGVPGADMWERFGSCEGGGPAALGHKLLPEISRQCPALTLRTVTFGSELTTVALHRRIAEHRRWLPGGEKQTVLRHAGQPTATPSRSYGSRAGSATAELGLAGTYGSHNPINLLGLMRTVHGRTGRTGRIGSDWAGLYVTPASLDAGPASLCKARRLRTCTLRHAFHGLQRRFIAGSSTLWSSVTVR